MITALDELRHRVESMTEAEAEAILEWLDSDDADAVAEIRYGLADEVRDNIRRFGHA